MGRAKAESRVQHAETKQSDQRPKGEPQVPLAQALMVVTRPEAQHHSRASPETAKGCKPSAEAGLEDWLSTAVTEADGDLIRSKVIIYIPCRS